MLEVIIFIGLQGAGKSTFYQRRLEETHVLVSKDRFRNNRRPELRQRQLISEALAAGRSVVVDNTNPSPAERAAIIEIGRSFNARIVGYLFVSILEECRVRNAARTGAAQVPDVALLATAKKLVRPAASEGFDELWAVRTLGDFRFDINPYPESNDEP